MKRCDVLVLGCGPAGERAAIQAARSGRDVVVVEKAGVVGGNRVNWGTIPSKTLRESALFVLSLTRNKIEGVACQIGRQITVADFMHRERAVVSRELELVNRSLDRYRIEVVHGHARFVDPHTVEVSREGAPPLAVEGSVVVIAVGSSPRRPAEVPFDDETVLDSETVLRLARMPRSMVVLGAGVVGIEYASIFAALDIRVTLVDTRDRLLPYCDREIVGVLERELARLGVEIVRGRACEAVERVAGEPPGARCRLTGGAILDADVVLYCVGRDGNTRDLSLERIGVAPNAYGLLAVNEHYQTAHPHLYAVGDVIGYPALASTAMEQGRRAIRHAFGLPGVVARTEVLPIAVYAIPELSYVGATEEALREKGISFVAGRGRYDLNARGQISGDLGGMLKLLFDEASLELLGVHIIGTGASELVHIGEAFLRGGATAQQIAETLFNYPTLADLYRHAALEALGERERRGPAGR